MCFNDIFETEFMRKEGSEFFKPIQKGNGNVAVGNPTIPPIVYMGETKRLNYAD
jgi:hypothetical protein